MMNSDFYYTHDEDVASQKYLGSSYADDPDLAELSDLFAAEMPLKTQEIRQAFLSGDQESLIRLVHRIKGAAGSYGFSVITPLAARLERSLQTSAGIEVVRVQLDELVQMCNRIRPSRLETI